MIYDKIENIAKYFSGNQHMEKLNCFLKEDFNFLADGKYEIEGDEVFAILLSYYGKDENCCNYERHKKYIDIQAILEGEEKMFFSSAENMKEVKEYDVEKDILFENGEGQSLIVSQGEFVAFFPQDSHMPSIKTATNCKIRKLLIKIKQ